MKLIKLQCLLFAVVGSYAVAACYTPTGGQDCSNKVSGTTQEGDMPSTPPWRDCEPYGWQQVYTTGDLGVPKYGGSGWTYLPTTECRYLWVCTSTITGNADTVPGNLANTMTNSGRIGHWTTNCGSAPGS